MRNLLTLIFLFVLTFEASGAIKLVPVIKGNAAEITKLSGIIPRVQTVVNSEAFRLRVLKAKFSDTKDSSEQVLAKILAADWDLEYEFKMQRNWRGKCPVLGWTYSSVKTVWFNSCTFLGRSDSGVGGTVAHEQMHKLGYKHRSSKSLNSVPYAIGTIVAELY